LKIVKLSCGLFLLLGLVGCAGNRVQSNKPLQKPDLSPDRARVEDGRSAISNPVEISVPDSPHIRNRESLIQMAQLNEEQVKILEDLDGVPFISELSGGKKGIFKVILPGYIPQGYSLHSLTFRKTKPNQKGFYGALHSYQVNYKNANGQCFSVGAYIPPAGLPTGVKLIDVYSPALGNLVLISSEFDSDINQSRISLDPLKNQSGGYVYDFSSPSYSSKNQQCKTINLQEAIKIVESLDYLKPQPIAKSRSAATPKGDFNAEIIDPPSNCRSGVGMDSPVQQKLQKGDFLVNRDAPQTDGKGGTWYREQYLGCWIHESQLRFK
jgi:hypothetical protein